MPELKPADAPGWQKWVTDFDQTASKFRAQYQILLQQRDYVATRHPELRSQYEKLVSDGQKNLQTLSTLESVRNTVSPWLASFGQYFTSPSAFVAEQFGKTVDTVKNWFGLNGLGFAPVIVAVGLASAVALLAVITKWIADCYMLTQRLNALKAAEDRGYTAEAAANAVNQVLGKPAGASASGIAGVIGLTDMQVKLIIFGGLALLALPIVIPPIMRFVEGRR